MTVSRACRRAVSRLAPKRLAAVLLLVMLWPGTIRSQSAVDSILCYQLPNGGWMKNQRWEQGVNSLEYEEALRTGVGATIDNGATWGEIRQLAAAFARMTGDGASDSVRFSSDADVRLQRLSDAIRRGICYLLQMQYENGGFPQFFPPKSPTHYSRHITFNDNAMTNVLRLLRDISAQQPPFDRVPVPDSLRQSCRRAYERGVCCILQCQIVKDGRRTVWCQQHDAETLLPAAARAYELPSMTGNGETCDILRLLMEVEQPDVAVVEAVDAGVRWLSEHRLTGIAVERFVNDEGMWDKRVVQHADAAPLWARYYDLEDEQPFFCDRDGILRRHLSDIGYERRNGYSWLGSQPQAIFELYEKWRVRVQ